MAVSSISPDEVQQSIAAAGSAFDQSGILMNDETDSNEISVCALIPEGCVAVVIGKGGVNIAALKDAAGVNFSFTKKDTSMHNLRRAFVSGSVAGVSKALMIAASLTSEHSTTGGANIGIVVTDKAAGSVIGKGGENLKQIREATGCKVSMEKPEQAVPIFCGRSLTLEHESAAAIAQAAYLVIRLTGFASPRQQDKPADGSDVFGFGAAFSGGRGVDRFSPYGAVGAGAGEVCALHGKKRGSRNLQPHPTIPGQFVCRDTDECKGNAGGAAAYAPAVPVNPYAGLPGMVPGMGMMDAYGYSQMGMMQQAQQAQQAQGQICSVHNKRRGARNLVPHSSVPGLFECAPADQCK